MLLKLNMHRIKKMTISRFYVKQIYWKWQKLSCPIGKLENWQIGNLPVLVCSLFLEKNRQKKKEKRLMEMSAERCSWKDDNIIESLQDGPMTTVTKGTWHFSRFLFGKKKKKKISHNTIGWSQLTIIPCSTVAMSFSFIPIGRRREWNKSFSRQSISNSIYIPSWPKKTTEQTWWKRN